MKSDRPPTTVPPTPAGILAGGHVMVLDGLRGSAVLLVLLLHLLVSAETMKAGAGTWLAPVQAVCSRGWIGVDLFFVLSGFLITGILFDAKGTTGYFRNFYLRRSLRIFPLYYVTLAAFFLLVPGVLHFLPSAGAAMERVAHGFAGKMANLASWQRWFWLYGTNFFLVLHGQHGEGTILGHFWTLAIEEHFYLVWPLVVFCCSRRTLLWICGATFVVAFTCRWLCWQQGLPDFAAYCLTPCRLDSLTTGGLAALLIRGPAGITAVSGLAWRSAWVATPLALGALVLWGDPKDYPMSLAGFPLLAITFATLLLALLGARPESVAGRVFNHPILRWFGKFSYGIYVIHYILRTAVPYEVFRTRLESALGSAPAGILAYAVLVLVLSMLLAQVSWVLLERPCLSLKRFFPMADRHRAPAAFTGAPTGAVTGLEAMKPVV